VSCLIQQEWKGVFTFLPLLIFWNTGREKIAGETWIRFFKSGRNVNKPNGRRGFMLLWLYTKLNYNSIHVYIEYICTTTYVNKQNGRRGFMLLWLYTKLYYHNFLYRVLLYVSQHDTMWSSLHEQHTPVLLRQQTRRV
jgi:hypothetical protein